MDRGTVDKKSDSFQLTWLPKKTFEILVTIPWSEIKKERESVAKEAGKEMEIKGFRKGMAPPKIVLEHFDKQKLLEAVLSKILPDNYQKAVSRFGLKPIASPKIELVSNKDEDDWQVKFTSCEIPDVSLGNYKDDLRGQKAASKIWKPGEKPEEKEKEIKESKEAKLQKAIEYLQKNIKVEVSDLLLEEEVTHKLSQLLDQSQKLGITIEQYLTSLGKTTAQLREEYKIASEKNLSLEFILNKIAETEKITVSSEEIEKAVSSAKSEEEKKSLEAQKYLLASILRQQKTLDFLSGLV